MPILNNLFQKYRNQNIKRGQVNPQPKEYSNDRFGEEALRKNPNLPIFDNAQNNIAEIIDRRSVVSQYQTTTQLASPNNYFSSLFAGISAMPVYSNKGERIRQYRAMAAYPECRFCLDELADDFIHEDETGQFIHLNIPEEKTHLNENQRKILQIEFSRFIDLFKFKEEAFLMVKRFLVEGELAFENIINIEKPELGIIGIKYLPAEYYETLLNPQDGKTIGILFDKENLQRDLKTIISNSCLGSRGIFNNTIAYQANITNDKENSIPILWPQLTYISSGESTPDGLISYPLIENCKQSYHQLALMQDAAVILRVTRAPERLLFNISTGGQPDKIARQKIREFINELKSKKVVSSAEFGEKSQQDIRTTYNPVTMLETYFFGKSNANDGTTIDNVTSTADYEQIADIEFFLRRLFKAFKVPFSRYKTPENSLERDETITYEEYSMARAEIRFQRRFSLGIKRSFITDLKLVGLWKKYGLKESDFSIDFITPILYDLYQQQKMIGAKMDAYKTIVDQEEFSKINAMKKILRMTDDEIEDNFRNLIKEKQLVALADYFADKISDDHKPLDYKSPLRLAGEGENGDSEENKSSESGTSEETSSEEGSEGTEDSSSESDSTPTFGLD